MQEQSQGTSTWRIGFDLAAFVMLATIAGMAAAVTLASIALLLTGVMSSTPGPASSAPLTIPQAPAATPGAPAAAPVWPVTRPDAPAAMPTTPAADPDAPEETEAPGQVPTLQTQLAGFGSEIRVGLDQDLRFLDVHVRVERKRDVEVQHIAD